MTENGAPAAAAAIASALKEAAAQSTGHRRLYLRDHLSVPTAAVFDALEADLTQEVTVGADAPTVMAAARVGTALLIPYLVDPNSPGPNRGLRGYAGTLRTDFAAQATAGTPYVLLILDEHPFETVLTAAEDAADRLPELGWTSLVRRIAQGVQGPASGVVACVADDLGRLPEELREGDLLDEFAAFAAADWDTAEQAGRALAGLKLYLGDTQPTLERLRQSREWRKWLETWSRPDRDLTAELVRYAGEMTPGIQKVLGARGVSGLNWHGFTLSELPSRQDKSPAVIVSPAQLHGVRSFLPNGGSVAAWMGVGDGSIAVSFTGSARGASSSARVRWAGREPEPVIIDQADLVIRINVPGEATTGWQFGHLELRRGQRLDLAVFRGEGDWFPVERSLELDTLAEAFIAGDPPSIAAVGPGGVVVGTAVLSAELGDQDERVDAAVSFGGTQQHIPLIADADPDVPPLTEPGGTPTEGEGPTDDEELEGKGPGGSRPGGDDEDDPWPVPHGPVATGAHALLEFAGARAGSGLAVQPDLLVFQGGDSPEFSGGGINRPLEPQALADGLDGLALERDILSQPKALAFSVVREGSAIRLAPDRVLESLSLDSLHASSVQAFFAAREAFFAALADKGSVHALMCGTALQEARAYVSAYQELLLSIPVPGRYEPEYDRLLLCDLVADSHTGQRWLAPTNPVTVAWALELADTAKEWALQETQLPARDLDALTPAFLLPLLHHEHRWWETDTRSPRLWRRYQLLSASLALGNGDPRTITRRFDKFLAVFPVYKDPRQRLAVAVHEPGDADSVADALRAFYGAERRPEATVVKPGMDITVYSADGHVPEKLARLVATDNDDDVDKFVRSRISLTCRPTDGPPSFAHLSFVFRSPAQREPRLAAIGERAPTTWVAGLAAGPGRYARIGANQMEFASGLFADPLSQPLGPLLTRTLELVGGQPRGMLADGATQVTTTVVPKGAMKTVYASSVWTTHADRLMGPEAFGSDPASEPSIVDFDDRSGYWQAGLDSITVTDRMEPYRVALGRAFADRAHLAPSALGGLIRLGNAVSGQWNLDLLSLDNNRVRERVGVLAAIAALRDLDGAFEAPQNTDDLGGILVSLEELFRLLKGSGVARPAARLCDDLLYMRVFTQDEGRVQLRCRLIEVKYTEQGLPDRAVARAEVEATQAWLSDLYNRRGPAMAFRARDLSEFIRIAAARNASFGLHGPTGAKVEEIATAIAEGKFDLDFGFTAGGQRLTGDVISLELDSPLLAHRQRLPGDGAAMGYIRLGAPTLQRLATGEELSRPQGWAAVAFPAPASGAPEEGDSGTGGVAPEPSAPSSPPSQGQAEPTADPAENVDQAPSTAAPEVGHDSVELEREVAEKAAELDDAAAKYELNLAPFDTAAAQVGPSVIRYRTRLLGKQTIAGVRNKALDIGREIGVAEGVLVDQEPYFLTVDVPRSKRVVVPLETALDRLGQVQEPGALPFLLGVAPSGEVSVQDLARLPHLLVAGATGSGKSVLLRGLLCCLARVRSPQQLNIMIIDPKQVDFMPFEDLPHLVDGRIITDPAEAISVLADTLEAEVGERRAKLKAVGATSALEFYEMGHSLEELPQMVILVDEFADLAGSLQRRDRQSFMGLIQRFGQLTRAFGIYLVLATQRPSVQVITGDIKANLTARVALKMQSAVDSTTILGRGGAETLRDRGDLLFDHGGTTQRLQAFYTTLDDVRAATST